MELMEHQLKTAKYNITQVKKQVDKRLDEKPDGLLENYHYELLDMELRLDDLIRHLDKME